MSSSRARWAGRASLLTAITCLTLVAGCTTKPVTTTISPDRRDAATPGTGDGPPGSEAGGGGQGGQGGNADDGGGAADGPSRPDGVKGAAGEPCSAAEECDTGFCSDGVCCTVACTGACLSCALPERMGECLPVPAGQTDPHQVCRQDDPDTCGQSGTCNGQGGCAKYAAGTVCGAGVCSDARTVSGAAECDGDGVCESAAPLDCFPFTCAGGSCRSSCAGDADCVPPNVCVDGSCGKRGRGQACTAGEQCTTGFCVDGVCCDNACTGRCSFCALAGTRGTCTAVKANTPDPRAAMGVTDAARVCLDQGSNTCGNDGRCNGQGGCQKYRDGTTCRAGRCDADDNAETGSGTCRGGSCQIPDARSCAPYNGCSGARCRTQCTANGQCAAPNVCTDGSCGKRPVGATCSRDGDCAAPGICAQGRCCSSACNTPCRACNLEGQQGTCAPVPVGGADPSGTCRDDACSNGCNGAGGCRREPEGFVCRAAACSGTGSITRSTCDAGGVCRSTTVACPAGQTCTMNRCAPPAKKGLGETCVANLECQSNACVAGRCCASACAGAPCRTCTAASGWMCVNAANGTGCGLGRTCQAGACTRSCPGNQDLCGTQCVNLNNDELNCGECGKRCSLLLPVCTRGVCTRRRPGPPPGPGPVPQEP